MAPRIVSGVRHSTLEEATAALPRVRAQVERICALVAAASARDAGTDAGTGGNGHAPSPNGHAGSRGCGVRAPDPAQPAAGVEADGRAPAGVATVETSAARTPAAATAAPTIP